MVGEPADVFGDAAVFEDAADGSEDSVEEAW